MERLTEVESLQEIIADGRTDTAKTHEKTSPKILYRLQANTGGRNTITDMPC